MDVILYTDGSARGNPNGPGGYGAVLQYVDASGKLHEREYSQGYIKTTNNRMEQCVQPALDRGLDKERLEARQE